MKKYVAIIRVGAVRDMIQRDDYRGALKEHDVLLLLPFGPSEPDHIGLLEDPVLAGRFALIRELHRGDRSPRNDLLILTYRRSEKVARTSNI
jgi:hypothetical protein